MTTCRSEKNDELILHLLDAYKNDCGAGEYATVRTEILRRMAGKPPPWTTEKPKEKGEYWAMGPIIGARLVTVYKTIALGFWYLDVVSGESGSVQGINLWSGPLNLAPPEPPDATEKP